MQLVLIPYTSYLFSFLGNYWASYSLRKNVGKTFCKVCGWTRVYGKLYHYVPGSQPSQIFLNVTEAVAAFVTSLSLEAQISFFFKAAANQVHTVSKLQLTALASHFSA